MATRKKLQPDEPVTTLASPVPLTQSPVSDPEASYIAGDSQYAYWTNDRALPQTIDEAERNFGLTIYRQMASDPILGGAVRTLKTRVLSDGISFTSRLAHMASAVKKGTASPEEIADYEQAETLRRYIELAMERCGLHRIKRVIRNLIDATYLGHKLAEVTYDILPDGEFEGMVGLASIATKPRENYTIVLGPRNEFRGVIAKIPGVSIMVWQGILLQAEAPVNMLDPFKVMILNFDEEDGNPQGRSWFRECYAAWKRKQTFQTEEMAAGVGLAGGKLAFVAPEENTSRVYVDPDTGQQVHLSTTILKAARRVHQRNGGVGVFPAGTLIQPISPSINEKFFESAIDRCDREMTTAYLLTARAVLEARHGSKADSESAQDILDELVMAMRGDICDAVNDIIRRMVLMSFGHDIAAKFSPECTMQKASRPNFAANATAVAALQSSGYLDPSQLPMVDEEILGLDARTLQEMDSSGGEPAQLPVGFRRALARAGGAHRRGLSASDARGRFEARIAESRVRCGEPQP